jgi:hypothetical protein
MFLLTGAAGARELLPQIKPPERGPDMRFRGLDGVAPEDLPLRKIVLLDSAQFAY